MITIPFMWCYAYPNAMEYHRYTDDAALCFALTRKRAIKKFERLYRIDLNDKKTEIFRVSFNSEGIAILTDY
jgi:hypothetical protein